MSLSPSQKQELSTKKHILRKLVKPQNNKKRRNLLVKQKGGFIPLILCELLKHQGSFGRFAPKRGGIFA